MSAATVHPLDFVTPSVLASLHRSVRRRFRDTPHVTREVVEDAVGEAMVTACERPPRGENPVAWLHVVACNAIRTGITLHGRRFFGSRPLEVLQPADESESAQPDAALLRAETPPTERERAVLILRHSLDTLPDTERRIMELHDAASLPFAAIEQRLGVARYRAEHLLRAARTHIRAHLQAMLADGTMAPPAYVRADTAPIAPEERAEPCYARALHTLRPRDRTLVVRCDHDERTIAQAAKEMGLHAPSAHVFLRQARARLRRALRAARATAEAARESTTPAGALREQLLTSVLATLPAMRGEIVARHEGEGQTYPAIARTLGLNAVTCKAWGRETLATLRRRDDWPSLALAFAARRARHTLDVVELAA